MTERKPLEPVAWIFTEKLKAPGWHTARVWRALIAPMDYDAMSALYTADQIRSLVEEVRCGTRTDAARYAYGVAIYDFDAALDAILARLEDR